ncbi:MAG TPA: enoyl-CoA hydratase-related protein [Myxococcota bacterium]|nr:enoyl-CoA hydratase-related protein [Myxococcota bacterium]
MGRETVLESLAGGVLRLTLNRPAQKNAFNSQQWRELREALAEARASDSVRVVLLTGAGGAFSAGQDLSEMAQSTTAPAGGGSHPFGAFMDELCRFDKPLVAAVNGVAVGIGLTILLHCDFVYVAEGARLRAPFITLGVVPEAGSSFLLPLLIGWRGAQELLFGDGWLTAQRATELGLATRLCSPAELLAVAEEKAAALAALPPAALRHTKQLLLATRESQLAAARAREDDAFRVRVGSPENLEAVRAFFEKRAPDFRKL